MLYLYYITQQTSAPRGVVMADIDSRVQTVAAGVAVVTMLAENQSEKTANHCDMYAAGMYMHILYSSRDNQMT